MQADFDTLVLMELLDPDAPDMAEILDGVAKGLKLNAKERKQARAFRERLVAMIERHNARLTDADSMAAPSEPQRPETVNPHD